MRRPGKQKQKSLEKKEKTLDKLKKICYNKYVKKKNNFKKEVMSMTNTKMTKRDWFNTVIEMAQASGNDEMVKWATHEIKLLDDKKNRATKPSKATLERREENEGFRVAIVNALATVEGATNSELQELIPTMATFYPSRIAAIIKPLVDNGTVAKATVKGRVVYSLVTEVEGE